MGHPKERILGVTRGHCLLPETLLQEVIDRSHSHWKFSKAEVIQLLEDGWGTVITIRKRKFISRPWD